MIASNLTKLKQQIPKSVQLVAVSKTKPVELLMEAYQAGQRVFGENKVQELVDKHDTMPKDIQWHFIGHLQTNKVKYIASFVSLIHAVDSLKLLKEINKQGSKHTRVIDVLLQFHIADEESKFGLKHSDALQLLDDPDFFELKNIRIIGLMGMATFTQNNNQIRDEFRKLHHYHSILKAKQFKFADYFKEISMGMSGDYNIAIEEGSTMVRVGSLIFGSRN